MEGTTIAAALVSALSTVADEMMGVIADILPVAAPVIGAGLVVTFGIKVFKKFTK